MLQQKPGQGSGQGIKTAKYSALFSTSSHFFFFFFLMDLVVISYLLPTLQNLLLIVISVTGVPEISSEF